MSIFGKGVAINSRFLLHHVRLALTLALGDHLPGWIFIEFLFSQHPIRRFREVSRHRANGDGMTFSLPDAFVEYGDMLDPPVSMTSLANDNIGSFDECPFEILVGLLPQSAIADLSATGFDCWNSSRIASEMSRRRKAIHGSHLALDHDRQDVGHAGKRFEKLDVGGDFNPLLDALFEFFDLALNMIQCNQMLLHAALRFWRKGSAGFRELRPPFGCKDIAVGVQG